MAVLCDLTFDLVRCTATELVFTHAISRFHDFAVSRSFQWKLVTSLRIVLSPYQRLITVANVRVGGSLLRTNVIIACVLC